MASASSSWSASSLFSWGLTNLNSPHGWNLEAMIIDYLYLLTWINDNFDSLDSDGSFSYSWSKYNLNFPTRFKHFSLFMWRYFPMQRQDGENFLVQFFTENVDKLWYLISLRAKTEKMPFELSSHTILIN